ncbi:MAG: hypothetical protein LBT23_10610 [Synergistaceae bacterium]|nr:hypothetical protein [Synergistaceae bacterium]
MVKHRIPGLGVLMPSKNKTRFRDKERIGPLARVRCAVELNPGYGGTFDAAARKRKKQNAG